MTLDYETVAQNFPSASTIQVGERITVKDVPASTYPGGVTDLEIHRLTDQYFSVQGV
jgi:hypothetical protein